MKNVNLSSSVNLLTLSALSIVLMSFIGIIYLEKPLVDLQHFFFIKLAKSVACFSILLFWHFVRQSNEAEYNHSDFRCWQIGALLLVQGMEGVLSLASSGAIEREWVTAVNLLVSGGLLYSLYSSFLRRSKSDLTVLSAIGLVFLVLISYSLNGNTNVITLVETNLYAVIIGLVGASLLLSISVICAQHKMDNYSELELLSVVILTVGYLEFMGREQHILWAGAIASQLLFVVLLIFVVIKVYRETSVDWSMFDAGLNMSPHAYFLSDKDGNIRFVNEAYRSLFEIAETEAIANIKHPLYTHPLEQSISSALALNKKWEGETVIVNDFGKVNSVYAKLSLMELNGIPYQHGWFQDIKEKKTFKETQNEILDKLERLSLDLMEKQEEERSYFAKELHDEIGQGLTLLKIQHLLPEPDKELITSVLSELIDKVRNLSLNLRPAILDDMGISAALTWLVDRQTKFSKLDITSDISTSIPRLSDKLEISVFRIAQEAFTNIHKYSHADKVSIKCHIDSGYLQLQISDNGVGFDIDAKLSRANQGQSLGLLSLRERALLVNGLVDIDSTPESGTRIELRAPISIQVTEEQPLTGHEE